MDGHDAKDGRYQRVRRRHIYLHRLAGDDALAAKIENQSKAPFRMVIRFAIYAFIATFVIKARSQVEDLSMINDGIVPTEGVCLQAASISLSFRQVKLSNDSARSTTERFAAFFPQTWTAATIDPAVANSDSEATLPILAGQETWRYTPSCSDCGNAGFNNAGGYIAVATTSSNGTFVHLVDNDANATADESVHHCNSQLKRSGTVTLDEFLSETFFDPQLGSLTLEFQTYNANLQSITMVGVFFQFYAAGTLLSHHVQTQTLQLDISHGWIQYFEYAYLIFTCFYFFELIYRIGKGFPTYLKSMWCYVNGLSIISSISCFGIWYVYMPTLATFRRTDQFQNPSNFVDRSATFAFYTIASSFAVFTIYLRMLQFLAATRSRVVLLLRTIMSSASNMVIYISYIGVIFIGFSTFALTSFAQVSANFVDPGKTFVSTFTLFMGDLSVMDGFSAPMKIPFMWLFMFFFFFLSVQMFNAIINYAYNRVSEDMKSVFVRESFEKELKQRTPNRSLWRFVANLRKPKAEEQEDIEAFDGPVKQNALPDLTTLDPAVRQKVEEYRERDTNKGAKDGLCTAFVYFILVGCYIWFLYVNMAVEEKSSLRLAVEAIVKDIHVPMQNQANRSQVFLQSWDEISSWPQVVTWMQLGLPALIFNSTTPSSMAMATTGEQMIASGLNCLRAFNCFVTGSSGNATSIARITQKRSAATPNRGARSSSTPEDERFIGGIDNGTGNEMQGLLVNTSGYHSAIFPNAAGNPSEDSSLSFQLTHQNSPLCSTAAASAEGSYKQTGGIVCELSADFATFHDQMATMTANSFFVKETASLAVELVAHNSNRDMLSYIVITFRVTPAGKVHKDMRIFSLALFGWDVGVDKLGYFIARLLPGAVYMALVVAFTIMLYREMQLEHARRSVAEGPDKRQGFVSTIISFFSSDVFRPIDAVSYLMSFWSFVLFILWLVKEGDLQTMWLGSYGGVVNFSSELINQEKDYNRISAANLLLLFVRPLRFLREDPRMQRLNQTLHDAWADIFWFIIVLSIMLIACTLLANVSFGTTLLACSDIPSSFIFCFSFILGEFDFWGMYAANPVMAVIFFFPYLLLVYCVFTNIFFAILDRFFISADPPPMKLKRKLKPLLSKVCKCIDWDDDFVMEEDPKGSKKEGPKSRADRVAVTAKTIHDIRKGLDSDTGSRFARSKPLSEVCDLDERLLSVMKWSKDEAAAIVNEFEGLLVKKQQHKNEDVFLKQIVMKKVDQDESKTREEMEEAYRQMRYAAEVHEIMVIRDQQTLAKYIWLLEQKIQKKMTDKHALVMEVQHLQDEMDRMRFTKDDLQAQAQEAEGMGTDIQEQEDAPGTEEEEEFADLSREEGASHAAASDPNAAMDSTVPGENPTTVAMLKALNG
ncbi:unnamed protein product [Effrenium voratum]|nr:unnamed protein product [Effrenium voratum]